MAPTRRPISARVRILGAILAVASVGLVIVGSVTFLVQRERLLADVDGRLRLQIESLMSSAPGGGTDITIDQYASVQDFLYDAVSQLTPGRNEGTVAVFDGEPLYHAEGLSGFAVFDDEALLDAAAASAHDAGTTVLGTVVTAQGPIRYIAVPVRKPGDPHTGLYVRGVDLEAELAPVSSAITTFWIAAVAVLAATGVVGWFVMGRLLSPIRRIAETADAITLDDLSPRLAAEGTDEISDLTRTMNSMLDRLEVSVDVQRQLLDDVRHELKTPITIVRGHLEMMDPHDAADVMSAREIGIAELDRMTRLVEDIDLLAAAADDQFELAEVDLGQLTARVGELVTAIPGHVWAVEQGARGTVQGDRDRLVQAWLQLADNAAKYTPTGSPIEIGSAFTATTATLWVRDHGGGVPPALRHRIFRRFDRAHGKRSVGGSGLGLAIVDTIAKAHSGHCTVTDTPGGGATFTIHLPLPTAELPAPVRAGDVVLQREASE